MVTNFVDENCEEMNRTNISPATTPQKNHLLKAEEVAEYLNVSKSFAYFLIQTGQIPAVRMGRSVRIRPEDLEDYIQANISPGRIAN